MFVYQKKLQYPINVKNSNPRLASVIISQYGGPDGELGAGPCPPSAHMVECGRKEVTVWTT